MYLITVEGGDGSGKGEAVRILREVAREFPFPEVNLTQEPRRLSPIGALAMEAVKKGNRTPLQEAGLFAADRVDHSHTWIMPRLERGELVISDRNVHSSLVYQGIIGELGLDRVASMNAGALVPDLVIWLDCDPEVAMQRIRSGTLRIASKGGGEYFETTEIQSAIRAGFHLVLGEERTVSAPFDRCEVVGPILNEGSKKGLRKSLTSGLRSFLNRRPVPINVDPGIVDRHHLSRMVSGLRKQKRLPGAPTEDTSLVEGWLGGDSPAAWMERAEQSWSSEQAREADVPGRPLAHPVWSIMGTLSFIGTTDIPRLRRKLGPVRTVTQRHSQRMVRWFDSIGWTTRQAAHVPFSDAPLFKIHSDWVGLGRLWLVLWPVLSDLSAWRRRNPDASWDDALQAILSGPDGATTSSTASAAEHKHATVDAIISRLSLLTSGHVGCPAPGSLAELLVWWSNPPPQ